MLTPPITRDDQDNVRMLQKAVHVLNTEATALSQVTLLYETDPLARESLTNAVDCVARINEVGGKLIICGIGKSGLIGMKTVATMKSLGLGASFLHAAEAMHGDLGDIRDVRSTEHTARETLTMDRMTRSCSSHTQAKQESLYNSCRTYLPKPKSLS